jgi:hypothetical protein
MKIKMDNNKQKKIKRKNHTSSIHKKIHLKNTLSARKTITAKSSPKRSKKKSSHEKTIVKKSLTTTKTKDKPFKTRFLIIALIFCVLSISTITFILLFQFRHAKNTLTPPVPSKLSIISNEDTFLTIKNSLLQNILGTDEKTNTCLGDNFFHKPPQKTAYVYNKFIVILKRGKIFVTNSTTNKFVGHMEISPYPIKENNAITYNNVFFSDGVIITTGYRIKTSSLEISTFPINSYGKITRGETYNLPSSDCNFGANVTAGKLTFYTSQKLSPGTTTKKIKSLDQWSAKLNEFITTYPTFNNIFYNNSAFLNSPTVHTITTCELQKQFFANCAQRHLIGNHSSGHYLDAENFYVWTTQPSISKGKSKIIPNSKLYQFNLSKPTIKITQVEGTPISTDAISIKNNQLLATIYQNDYIAPAWQTTFNKNKLAHFTLDLNEFTTTGSFVNSSDNYTLLPANVDASLIDFTEIIAISPELIVLDKDTSTITSYAEAIKSFSVDGVILTAKESPDKKTILIVYKKNTSLMAQTINIATFNPSKSFRLQENTGIAPLAKITFLEIQDQLLIGISLINKTSTANSLYLLNFSLNTLILSDKLTFTKAYQRVTDNCQNDCHQSWRDQVKYFTAPALPTRPSQSFSIAKNRFVYAVIGSKLRKLIIDTTGSICLSRTIDYTYRPAPPKPRARIPVGAKIINGKYTCGKKHGYVGKSKKNNKGYLHLDLECCLDPDEYPNPWCTYKPGELSVTNLRYKDYHGKVKRKKH